MTQSLPPATPPNPTSRRAYLAIGLGVFFSVATLILLIQLIDLATLRDHLRHARFGYLAGAALVVYPLAMVARGQRWWWLLNRDIAWWPSLHILNVGYFANMVFPARLGEVVRLLLVRNAEGGHAGKAVSAVAVERLLDVLFALLTIALGLALIGEQTRLPREVITSLSVFTGVTVLGFGVMFFAPPLHPWLVRMVDSISGRFIPSLQARLVGFAERTLASMRQLAHPRYFVIIIGWTTLTWVLYSLFFHMILLALVDAPLVGASVLASGFIALSIGVPSVPSYAGPFHVGAALALSAYGYDETLGASFALLAHAIVTGLTLVVGGVSMQSLGTSLANLRRLIRLR